MNNNEVHDPVTGRLIPPGKVYARDGNLCFESLQTQNAYYKMLEQGFVVQFEHGKPVLKPGKMERVWELSTNEGNLARLTSLTSLPPSSTTCSLIEGRYQFQALAPELGESLLAGTNRRKIQVKLEVFSHNGSVLVDTAFDLTAGNSQQTVSFQVTDRDAPALSKMHFHSPSMLTKLMVKSSIDRTVSSKKMDQDADQAIALSKQSMKRGEFVVELVKDAVGVGMTFKWDAQRGGAAVKAIDPVGVASRSKAIKIGDIVRGVQGVRVDHMEFKQIQQLLRNVPMRVILVLEHAPASWKGFSTAARPNTAVPPPPIARDTPPPRPHTLAPSATLLRSPPPPPPPPAHHTSRPPPPPLSASPSFSPRAVAPPPPPLRSSGPSSRQAPPPPPIAAYQQRPLPPIQERISSPAIPARPTPTPPPPTFVRQPAPSLPTAPSPAAEGAFGAAYVKYERMKKSGLPEGAILNAMKRDSMAVPPGFFGSSSFGGETAAPLSVSVVVQPEGSFGPQYVKYERMKKSGLPDGAVMNAMNRDSVPIPAGFFGAGFQTIAPVKLDIPAAKQSASHSNGNGGNLVDALNGFDASKLKKRSDVATDAAPARGGGNLVDALKGFDASKLKRRDPEERAPPAPAAPLNPLMAELQKKAATGLRKRTQAELDAEAETKRAQQEAAMGKNLFNVALMKKFENALPQEDSDDDGDVDDDEWEM